MHSNSDQEIRISDDSGSSTTTNEQSLNLEHEIVVKPKKKTIKSLTSKRLCTFNKEWLKDPIYENFLRQCQTSKYFAHCSICKSDFSISNGSMYLVKRHMEQAGHKRLAEIASKEKTRSIFDFIPSSSKLTKITAAELSLVYHGVRHGHGYRSQSCTADLLGTICDDSDIGQHVRCGKTKSRQLSVNVLGPVLTCQLIDQVKQAHFYSVSFDGSNKGNIKMFPLVISYFSIQSGIQRAVLDVVEQARESAQDIAKTLRDTLKKYDLNIEKLTSIGADNSNRNFGRFHSVYSLIKLDYDLYHRTANDH